MNFSCFLGDTIGLITSDKNIIFTLTTIFIWNYPPLSLKNQKISNNAKEGEGKPDPSAILSFSCTYEAASIFRLYFLASNFASWPLQKIP